MASAIELTGKKWKAVQVLGLLIGIAGIILALASSGDEPVTVNWSSRGFVTGFVVTCIGSFVGMVGVIGAWWRHG
jgi:hypothetical protein